MRKNKSCAPATALGPRQMQQLQEETEKKQAHRRGAGEMERISIGLGTLEKRSGFSGTRQIKPSLSKVDKSFRQALPRKGDEAAIGRFLT